jgi:hypothetical protein
MSARLPYCRLHSQTRFPGLPEGAAAERAKLDKGNFWLHKFRATFAQVPVGRCGSADGATMAWAF